MLQELNRDWRAESSWVCLIGVKKSTLERREACTRFGHSDVARPLNDFTSPFLNTVTAR